MTVFDDTICQLGEGPLWHPERKTFFWFDILGKRLHARGAGGRQSWDFDKHVSAAGWVDRETLLVASEVALLRFDIDTGETQEVVPLEADDPVTRSNDGRADPWGGFWIGSMGKSAEKGAGAIWRYYRGALHRIVSDITISNAISFAPDRSCAYYADTVTQQIMRQPLEAEEGWPDGPPSVFADLREARLNPDGAVTDAEGNLWCAMWGAACVVCFGPDGREIRRIELQARQPTCPAFGGDDLTDLIVTSAIVGIDPVKNTHPRNGATLLVESAGKGVPEPRVIL